MKNFIHSTAFIICFTFLFHTASAQRLSGTYTIGPSGNYTSIAAAMSAMQTYGISGNVTFNISSGTYGAANINFASGIPNQGTYDTITFTSVTNNPNDVTIASDTSLSIYNAKNLVVKNLSIGSSTTFKGVKLDGICNNVEISNCNIRSNPIGNSNNIAGIYYHNTAGVANNIRVLNNKIDGGYYGIYFYGYNSTNFSSNFIVNNNVLSNAYLYGVRFYYISLNSFSNNSITSRTSNYSGSFYGVYIYYSNAALINRNKVQVLTTAIAYPCGMYFTYLNYRSSTNNSLISNNEILVFTNSNYYGMFVQYSRADIYNNSILVGGNGAARALYVYLLAGLPVNIKNNNLHTMAATAYPIYINSASVNYLGSTLKMDYNNYYNQTNIGYAGTDVTSMADWQALTGQDAHSVSVYPNYIDLFSYRLKTDGEGLICPRIASVPNDIYDTIRQAVTSMGAYHDYVPKNYDIKLLNLLSPQTDVSVGISTPIRATIMNMGANAVDSINIHWEINGVKQTYLWTGLPLSLGDSTSVITLGYFMPLAGENQIKVYTSLTGGKVDNNPSNDTVAINAFGCKNTINSVYTVGGSAADFTTIKEAIDVISYCGIATPTTIAINPGTYYENIVIPNIKGTTKVNTLTITAANGDSSSVIIQSLSSAPCFLLYNTNNLTIKNLTIKGVNTGVASTAIKFQSNNRDILITNNYITVSVNNPSSTTSTDIMALHSYTSFDTNITISNNFINGSGGIYFYSQSSAMTSNINILNNKLENIYYYGIYTYYTRVGIIKNNKIYQNSMAAIWGGGSGYGLYIYYSLGVTNTITDISNNLIRGAFGYFAYLYYCQSNNGSNTYVLFTNNSLIKTGAGTVNYLLYAYSGQLQCVNNTFVNIGSGTITNMAYFYGTTSNNINVSNNIFTSLTGTTNYLIYWNSTGNNTLDYNDYYTVSGNIAYHNNGAYASLSSWKSAYPTYNIRSKNVHPYYIDSLNFTKPSNWYPLICPRNEFVLTDIDGNPRTATTYMGCYEPLFTNDAGLLNFVSPTATSTGGDTTKITVKLFNYGTSTLNSITCKYKVNGVLYPQVIFNNLNLAKHKDTSLTIGVFIPILNTSTTIEAWCENPNGNTDQNVYNDSIKITTTGCSMVLNGEYTVGSSTADFTTIANALNALRACGTSGPVVFKLYNGTYPGFTIDTSYIGSSTTNTITFTSFTNNADNVIIRSNTTALILSKTHNIKFTHLTFDAQTGSKGINFIDTCSNIEIRNCKIKTNLTSSVSTNIGINKETTSFSIDNISIVGNTITGGYTGIQLYGASTLPAIGKNIRIDSNTIVDAYRYGLYTRDYIQFRSVSNNTIISRTSNAGTYFDGLYFYQYSEVDTIKNNKINTTKSTTTIYANGIYCYLVNYYSSTSANLHLINNEIIVRGNYYGIYAYYTRAQIIHNSIYIMGTSNSNGLYIYNTTTIPVNIMNNNIVNMSTGASATAIYVLTANTAISADYNNYYSVQGTPCRVSTPLYNLTSWQNATGLDYNSSSILPTYTNLAIDLRIKGEELLCRKQSGVNYDLYGTTRKQLTNMGAYHTYVPLAYDIMPLSIISPTEDVSNYFSVPIRISVLNRGDSAITDFDIHWSVNGVDQPIYHWTGTPLAMGDSTMPILIDYYSPSMGFNTFLFYTSLPNGNSDGSPDNDTISIVSFACAGELSGIYTIGGNSSDFEDITTAVRVLKTCGIADNVIFKIQSGTYNENISLLEPIMDASSPYTVTFTSEANHADSVIIKSNTTAIELGDVKNLAFKHLTLDVTNGQKGIEFSEGSENIEILHCNIKLNPTSTNNSHIGIYKPNNTGMLNNITIKNNLIDGGYYGIQMYAGESGNYLGANIIIDSNSISNSYYYGMYFYYSDIKSISYNQISSRYFGSSTYYYGIFLAYSNANIIGNKISNPSSINYSIGIYLYYYFNYYSTEPGIIANNEIITTTSNSSYGIYSNSYIRANIINNSILSKGGNNCHGIYVANLISGYTINIKNNNIVNQSAGYPIRLNSNTSDLIMDYNNYYAPTYIGYYSSAITSLSTWKSTVGKDQYSVNILPNFINTNVNLELQHGTGLSCPRDIDVLTDIKGLPRKITTTMGAYEPKYELELTSIAQPLNNSSLCLLEPADIKLVISNLKNVPVNFANDSMRVHIRITGTMAYQKDTTIKVGGMFGMAKDTFTVVRNYTPLDTGRYYILAYIDNMDINPINDTVRSNFHVNMSYQHKDTITLCDDELPFKYGDSTFKVGTVSGNYPIHFTLATGCDSLITLTLKVNPTYHHNRSLTICDNQLPLNYGDSIFPIGTTTGTYFIHFTLPTGCDSLIQLALTVHPTYKHFDTLTVCDSDFPFKYGDSTFKVGTVSGTYPVHFTLPTGCDSLITLTLKVNPTYKHYDTLTICDSDLPFKYGDSTFKVGTVSGNYPIHFTLATGCDSLITLTLKVNPTYHHNRSLTICDNQLPLNYGDSIFPIGTTTGTYFIHFTLPTGCDSLIQLALTVHPTYKHFDTLTVCDSDFPFKYGDSTFKVGTVSGNYPIHFTLPTGCDSLITLTLKVYPTYKHYDTLTICDSDLPFKYGDSTFKVGTVSGNYPIHFTLSTGCDSLITLTLKVNPTYHFYRSLTICDNQLPLKYGDSIFPIGTTTGTYFIHFTLPTGCDSLIQLALTVHPTYKHFDTLTLCDSDFPFNYGDSTFKVGTVSGNYPVHFTLPTGCDSLINLTLTVHPTYKHFDTLMVCDSDFPFNYGDSTFKVGTVSGNYPVHFTLPTGCDSLITLTLKVNPTYHFYRSLTICDDQLPLSYGDSIFPIGTVTGNYPIHFTLPTGCDSLIQLALTVHPTYKHFDTLTLCDSDFPFNYGDSTFKVGTVSGTYPIHFTLPTGCDSLVTLTLKVHPTYKHYDTLTICDSDLPFNYGDSTFKVGTVSGNYPVHFTLPTGCDSLITLTLKVNPSYSHYDTLTICSNQLPFNYSGIIFPVGTKSGTQFIYFTLPTGCDSLIQLFLTVNPAYQHKDTLTICDVDLPLTYGDSIFAIGTVSGNYPIHFTLPTGCDSLVTLTLKVNPTYTHYDTLTVCDSDFPFNYGDSTFKVGTVSGNYPVHFTLPTGCDSLINLILNVNPTYSLYDTLVVCNGDVPYTYGDSILNVSGNYRVVFSSSKGCDSIVFLNFNVFNCESVDVVGICDSELPYAYGDSIFNASGIYLVNFKTYLGLDSVVALTLHVYSTYNHFDTLNVCNSEFPIMYGDSTISIGGNYTIEFASIYGCDSTIDLTVYTLPSYNLFDTVSICDGELPYTYSDSLLASAGSYTFTLTTIEGCDSIIHLTLLVYPTYNNWDTLTICSGELPYQYGDSIFAVGSVSGTYPIHFTLPTGCDSLINLTLIINNSYLHTDTVAICYGDLPFTYGDSVFAVGSASGDYSIIFTLPTGCDSIILLTLNIFNCQSTNIVDICSNELPFNYGDSTFYAAGIYQVVFQSHSGLDSVVTLTLRVHNNYNYYDTVSICNSEFPYTYGDTVITTSGDYIISLLSSYGCDSIINLTLLTLPSYAIYDTIGICDNQLPYTYGDSIYNDFGDYGIFLKTEYGCDSIIHLHLLSLSSYVYSDTLSICSNELPYTYGDTIFDIGTMNGDYIIYLTSINGCDSVVNLNLSIYPIFEESVYAKICESELPYYFAGKEFDSGGTYEIVLVSIDGCDSIINLYLTVKNAPIAPDTIIGEIHIREAGNYTYSVEVVDSASSYIWTISNEEWLGSSTTNTIVVFISTSGSAYISVQAANECGSSEATEIYVQSSVGIKELNNTAEVNLYPNPANNYFYLKMNDIQGKTLISISDITGKVLRREEVDINSANQLLIFSTLHLSKGLYYVSIVNNNHTIVKKLIIE